MKGREEQSLRRRLAGIFFVWLAGCCLCACSGERRPPEDALLIGQAAEPRSLDPHVVTTTNDFRILAQMYEGLVRFQPGTLEVGPGLAERWTVDDGGRRFTFHLREGVRFHDGSVLDAEAVRFNFERLLDPDHPQADTGPFPMSFLFDRIETITTPDERTVVFTLSEPYGPFLSNLAYPSGFIVSPAAVREHGRRFGRHPSGTGPYRLRNWERRQWVELERFEGYRGAPARTPRVVFRALTDENARLTAMVAGELDILLEVPADIIGYFRERPGMAVAEATGPHLWFLILNTREPPFNDRRVRQAVNYAIDKESLVRDLLQDTAVVARGAFADAFAWARDPDLEPYPHDPDRARKLLEEAGAVGTRLHLLAPSSGSGMLEPLPMASAIQADLARVGLDVRIEVFEWNTFLARVNAGLTRPGEMAQMAWMTNDPDTLPSLTLSSTALPEAGGFNSGFFENVELDALLAAARRTTDLDARARYYRQADRLIHEEAPWAFVASWRQNAVHRVEVRGLQLEPSFLFDLAGVEKGARPRPGVSVWRGQLFEAVSLLALPTSTDLKASRRGGGGVHVPGADGSAHLKASNYGPKGAKGAWRVHGNNAGHLPPQQGLPIGWPFTQGVASLALGYRLLPPWGKRGVPPPEDHEEGRQ
ncbi:MAG: ABC transporter substrate-binding protein [Opitutales bacterium]|nr:ABC transporter substrate-binding protein [Opitutales bacterium]